MICGCEIVRTEERRFAQNRTVEQEYGLISKGIDLAEKPRRFVFTTELKC